MNIYARCGDKVIYMHPTYGYISDQDQCRKHLVLEAPYTIERISIGRSHTNVYLQEIPGVAFNSVMFIDVIPGREVQILVLEESDRFEIRIHDKKFYFNQEDSIEELVKVFHQLGYTNVHYEEVY